MWIHPQARFVWKTQSCLWLGLLEGVFEEADCVKSSMLDWGKCALRETALPATSSVWQHWAPSSALHVPVNLAHQRQCLPVTFPLKDLPWNMACPPVALGLNFIKSKPIWLCHLISQDSVESCYLCVPPSPSVKWGCQCCQCLEGARLVITYVVIAHTSPLFWCAPLSWASDVP